MTAFRAAMAALIADPNLGEDVVFRAGGIGPARTLRVLRSSPDRTADAFATGLLQASDVLHIAADALPAVSEGDTFLVLVGGTLLTALYAERDSAGAAWRIPCQR